MPEIKYVMAYIGPNQITEGFYTIEDGLITMVRPDGGVVKMGDDSLVQHQLKDGESEEAIAKVLTKQIRKHFLGDIVEGFSRDLHYQPLGVA